LLRLLHYELSLGPLLLLLLEIELLQMLLVPLLERSLESISLGNEILLLVCLSFYSTPVLMMDVLHVVVFALVEAALRPVHAHLRRGHGLPVVEAGGGFALELQLAVSTQGSP
jgi:hypothetical protein